MGYITKTKLKSEGSNQPDRAIGALGISLSSYYHAYKQNNLWTPCGESIL